MIFDKTSDYYLKSVSHAKIRFLLKKSDSYIEI